MKSVVFSVLVVFAFEASGNDDAEVTAGSVPAAKAVSGSKYPPYTSIAVPRGDFAYSGLTGLILVEAGTDDAKAFLRFLDPITQDTEMLILPLRHWRDGKIRATTWSTSYAGWIYEVTGGPAHTPNYVFIPDEPSKISPSRGYAIAYYYSSVGKWVSVDQPFVRAAFSPPFYITDEGLTGGKKESKSGF